MKEFRHILFMNTGNHDWKPNKSSWKFVDPKGQEYIIEKCTKCGMTAQRYVRTKPDGEGFIDSLYIAPMYPREHMMECPEEIGLFDHGDPEKEKTIAVLGGGEGKPKITRKKKKKKGKKDKKKKGKKNKITRNKTMTKIVRIRKPKKVKFTRTKKS